MSDLSDLGYSGPQFTWCNRRLIPHTVWERLDRACANPGWRTLFHSAKVENIPLRHSDHDAIFILLHTNLSDPNHWVRKRRFRFEAMWLKEQDCKEVINQFWSLGDTGDLLEKMNQCRAGLVRWRNISGKELNRRIGLLSKKIKSLRTGSLTHESKKRNWISRVNLRFY